MSNNLFAKDGFFWWVGVVEDRLDPLCLGRCRVRIVGYHLDNKIVLPTEDLPWAIPMQGITSAALSGKGAAPIGPLEGTWVIGFFADGKDCQQPVIMGTLAGIPGATPGCAQQKKIKGENAPGVKRDSNNVIIRDETGEPQKEQPAAVDPEATTSLAITYTLPPLTQTDVQNLMNAIGQRESSNNYAALNSIGYAGKYQFGIAALQTLGYVRKPISDEKFKNSDLALPTVWTGKNGITSLDDWFENKNNCQEVAMFELLNFNYGILAPKFIDPLGERYDCAGMLTVAHLLGPGGARNYKNGSVGKDKFGTSANEYYILGATAVDQNQTSSISTVESVGTNTPTSNTQQKNKFANPFGALNDPKLGQPSAYTDPNSVYPSCEYVERADTNKLACSMNVDIDEETLVGRKKDRNQKDINLANTDVTWDEPDPAFCAKYPYNHVIETESGHIVEMDDTPGRERLHIYHRTGTHIEIDRDGTFRQHVEGDNYEVFIRNNRIYTKGRWDMTVEGPASILAKDTADIEIFGKTTVNIHNDVDVNIAGDMNLKAKNINIETQENLNIVTGTNFKVRTAADFDVRVGGNEDHNVSGDFSVDAQDIFLNSGRANASSATATGLEDLNLINVDNAYPKFLNLEPCTLQENTSVKNDAGENERFAEEQVAAGVYEKNQVDQGRAIAESGCKRSDTNAPNIVSSRSVDGSEFNSFTDFPDSTQLSRSFTLGDVSTRVALVSEQNKVQSQRGLNRQQIMTNLKGLCCNTLDPIKAKYPNMFVTNAFRIGSGTSQHETGEAADLQFKGASKKQYYDIALWIRDNVAYDQLILEYKTTGTGNPWIHVSHRNAGNRAAGSSKVMTFMNHAKVKDFLCDLSEG